MLQAGTPSQWRSAAQRAVSLSGACLAMDAGAGTASAAAAAAGEWACGGCTFLNPPACSACEACGAAGGAAAVPAEGKILQAEFYGRYNGHAPEHLRRVVASLRGSGGGSAGAVAARRPLIWLAGDSSLDYKFWLVGPLAVPTAAAVNGYEALLDPRWRCRMWRTR